MISQRLILKVQDAGLIGGAAVFVDRNPDRAIVGLVNPPWAWGHCQLEFLHPSSPGVERYAEKLKLRIAMAVEREVVHRAKLKAAKLNGGDR